MSTEHQKTNSEAFFDRYFDISEVLIEYYANQPTTGIDRHFNLIEEFLEKNIETPQENKPLIIQCEEDFGVKTLLVKWLLYHKKNSQTTYPLQDIILPYFVTASEKKSNYFFAIFRFLMQLREKLNIKQKVELLEEKLRQFFGYWLDVCNRKIEKKIIKQKISEKSKIILIIHKIDNFIDPKLGKATNIGFWLPKDLPLKVRIIATCHKDSDAMRYFQRTGCTVIRAQNDRAIAEFMIDVYSNRPSFTEAEHKRRIMESLKKIPEENLINPKFLKTFVSCLIPYPDERIVKVSDIEERVWLGFYRDFDYGRLEKLMNNEDLIDFLLDYYEKKIMALEKFRKLVLILSICYKGLMFSEIIQLVKFSKEEWNLFLGIFKRFIVQFKGLFNCYDPSFKRVVVRKYTSDKECILLHEEIANVLEKTPLSTRKLEEQTHHLFISRSYFKLKETISIIEHFLLLFNPHNKFDLCHYWEKLLENGFDPAVEYNKAIEGFEMHYKPPPEDIFQIILQISRFLKEFSDFETENTPSFKHPPISGFSELNEIGLEKEIMNVGMYKKPDAKRTHPILTDLEMKNMEKQKSHEEFRQFYIEKIGIVMPESDQKISVENNIMVVENQIEPNEILDPEDESLSELSASGNPPNLASNITDLKVKIEGNNISSINNIQISNVNNSVTLKDEVSKLNLNVHEDKPVDTLGIYHSSRENQDPTYYYYKRWLWMIFPWACLSDNEKCNYSEKIMQCYSSATAYINVVTERKFTERALRIALDAKLKKKMMYAKKEELEELMALKSLKPLPSPSLRGKKRSMISLKKEFDGEKSLEGNSVDESQSSTSKIMVTSKAQKNQSMSGLKQPGGAFFITEQLQTGGGVVVDNILLNRSKIMELKFREYNPESLMYLNKNLEESSLLVLPKLKTSIIKHSDDEMYILERKVKKYKDQLDQVTYANMQMTKELENLQKIFANRTQKSQEIMVREVLSERIAEVEGKLKKVEDALERATSQKDRILTVLNVCKKNKQQNEEYIRSLNFLLQNFKKCIKMEIEDINHNRKEIQTLRKISQELLKAVEDKMENHLKLVNQIKNNINTKMVFNKEYDRTDQLIENSILEAMEEIKSQSNSTHEQNKELKKRMTLMDKTNRSMGDKLEKYEGNCEKLKSLLEANGSNFLESEKYYEFLSKLERAKELKREIMVKEDKVRFLRETMESKKKALERLSKTQGNSNEKEIIDMNRNELFQRKTFLEKEHDVKCTNFVRFTKTKLATNLVFKSILTKCDLPSEKSVVEESELEEFRMKITEYLENIRSKVSEEDYQKLLTGNYQIMEVYRKAIPKDSLLSNISGDFMEEEA